jgi:hypothetical protein
MNKKEKERKGKEFGELCTVCFSTETSIYLEYYALVLGFVFLAVCKEMKGNTCGKAW